MKLTEQARPGTAAGLPQPGADQIKAILSERRRAITETGETWTILDEVLDKIEADQAGAGATPLQMKLQIAKESYLKGYEAGLKDMKATIAG